MEEIAESLDSFIEKEKNLEELLRCHVQETNEALAEKLASEDFHPFQQMCVENIERLNAFMKELLEISDGEQEGAFVKV